MVHFKTFYCALYCRENIIEQIKFLEGQLRHKHSFIHIEHLYSASSGELLRGAVYNIEAIYHLLSGLSK